MTVTNNIVSAGLDILVDDIRSHRSDFNQAIMLNENGIARQIAMKNWWITSNVKVTK